MASSKPRKVVWTSSALRQFEEILHYIAEDSPLNAGRFADRIEAKADSLDLFAERGRMVPEFQRPDIRELLPKNYRLIYRLHEDRVVIVAFVHGSRLLLKAWKPDF